MSKKEKEVLRIQAIAGEELILLQLQTFLDEFPLDSDVNKTVALELTTRMSEIEQVIKELKNL